MAPAEIVRRARSCIGARFRLHGRDPATGLDCVGLAAIAYRLDRAPSGYALRGGDAAAIADDVLALGFAAAAEPAAGDLLMLAPGLFQHHFAIVTPEGFVHADARLRKVVETPGGPSWPVTARFVRIEG